MTAERRFAEDIAGLTRDELVGYLISRGVRVNGSYLNSEGR